MGQDFVVGIEHLDIDFREIRVATQKLLRWRLGVLAVETWLRSYLPGLHNYRRRRRFGF